MLGAFDRRSSYGGRLSGAGTASATHRQSTVAHTLCVSLSTVDPRTSRRAISLSPPTADSAATNPPAGFPRILPHLIYDDVDAAIVWLTEVFGFQERTAAHHTEADGKTGRAQMKVLDSLITIGRPSVHGDSPRRGVSSMLYVYVDDVEGHYVHAQALGAMIVTELQIHAGDRRYQVADLEGHRWTFAQHLDDAGPTEEHG